MAVNSRDRDGVTPQVARPRTQTVASRPWNNLPNIGTVASEM
jgi:hypothetical protein